MSQATTPPFVHTWDTRVAPPAHRFDMFCELVADDLAPHLVTSDHAHDFQASLLHVDMDRVRVSAIDFPTLRSMRTPRLIRRSDPELLELALAARGDMEIEQADNHFYPTDGDLVLYDTSRPYIANAVATRSHARSVVLHLPRCAVPVPDQTLRRLTATRLPARTGVGALLGQLLAGLVEQAPALKAAHARRVGSALWDLASAFLADLVDSPDRLSAETRQAALLLEIKSFICRHVGDPALSPPAVAAAHHISLRSLHYLFGHDDMTVGQFIREQRLGRCRADLADARLATRSVHEIGRRWGFVDPSAFNRAFRARYGLAPGAYRQQRFQAPAWAPTSG
ncbi:AraC-like DNA-binding protein [Streptomyces griseochromogenes]|uniref:AraC-like DNA-binding protein n=1 Tax=Streptomyces griseochromogenes TaxID=68214 RepID=A0A1B1AY11_9ACTN|nr:helix-turn-helix domain-containing protein [Streptomyces griseochromogenes]ANP51435.1 hypothetical protein AVL59_19105 [Streptomyces griseochromogenes]MBP2049815.1 AraC-like DNA-binding protein [Streptomyces griseochromogenes]